jgi:hypothetical protein
MVRGARARENLPPSLRFPPLREGNQEGTGTVCSCPPPLGSPRCARGTALHARSVPPAGRGNLKEGVHRSSPAVCAVLAPMLCLALMLCRLSGSRVAARAGGLGACGAGGCACARAAAVGAVARAGGRCRRARRRRRCRGLNRPRLPNRSASRRALALASIAQQRAAVRERLLQARLQGLPELEARWAAELRAEYDLDAIRAEYDAAWREAFQQHGQARFPLLVALILHRARQRRATRGAGEVRPARPRMATTRTGD